MLHPFDGNESLQTHFKFMRIALNQAEDALRKNEVPVGCIFVYNNSHIISSGMNNTNDTLSGIMHAELIGIEQILTTFSLKREENVYDAKTELQIQELFGKIDLYVTVEPCVMCGSALRQLGIRRVFFGAANDRFGGNGSIYRLNYDNLGIVSGGYKEKCQQRLVKDKEGSDTGFDLDLLLIESFDKTYSSYPDFGREEAIILLRKFYVQENKKAPVPQTRESDNRFLSLSNFPVMHYDKYITRAEFEEMYGKDKLYRFYRSQDASSWYVTEEGIEVEKFFDPLMPIKKGLYNEIREWEVKNGQVVIRESSVRIDTNDYVDDVLLSGDSAVSIEDILS